MRRLFILVATVILVDTAFYAAIAPLLPSYESDLGLSKTAAGLLSASYAAGVLSASVPSAYLAARRGPRAAMLTGLALLGGSSLAFAFAGNVGLLDSARFLQGVGGACSWSGGLAWLVRATPAERRGEVIGSAVAAAVAGAAIGPAIGGAATATSPELVFSAIAVAAAGLIALALSLPALPGSPAPSRGMLAAAVSDRRVIAGFALMALPALFSGTLSVLAPLRLSDLGASGLAVGAVFLVAAVAEAAMSPFAGRMSDRRGRILPLRAGLAAAIPAAILLPLPTGVALEAALVVVSVSVLAVFWAPAMALLSEAVETTGLDQGFAGGITNLAWAGGQVTGGAAGAAVADAAGDRVPYAVLALLCAVALLAISGRTRRRVAA